MAFSFKLQKIYQLPSYTPAPLALLTTIIRSDIATVWFSWFVDIFGYFDLIG